VPLGWSKERLKTLEKAAKDPRQLELPFMDNKPKRPKFGFDERK
jgi:hypothetical protein